LSAAELYSLDFRPPEVGTYTTRFGSPTVETSVGPLNDALVFHAGLAVYDQIELAIGTSAPVYQIDFDLLTHGLVDSEYAFSVTLDTPLVNSIQLHGYWNEIVLGLNWHVLPFSDDRVYHCGLAADLSAHRVSLTIDNAQTFTADMDGSRLESIRFSMGGWIMGASPAPGTYVALDNVVVTAVPWNGQVQTGDANFGVRTNQFGFTITGNSNLLVVVEACTSLGNSTWSQVGTNTLTSGSSYFSDPQWTNYPSRLYRVRSP